MNSKIEPLSQGISQVVTKIENQTKQNFDILKGELSSKNDTCLLLRFLAYPAENQRHI